MSISATVFKKISIFNQGLSFTPSALGTLLVVQAAWMRATLGRWPVPSGDDPTHGVARWLDNSTALCAHALVAFVLPLWVLSLVGPWKAKGLHGLLWHSAIFLGALVFLIYVGLANPFRFPEWWLD